MELLSLTLTDSPLKPDTEPTSILVKSSPLPFLSAMAFLDEQIVSNNGANLPKGIMMHSTRSQSRPTIGEASAK